MAINYVTIHSKVKAKIEAVTGADFRYVPVDKAVNLELGEYPAGLRNKGFTLRIASQGESKFEDANRFRLQLEIQFTLNGKSDTYLSQLSNCIIAVASLSTLRASDFSTYRGSDIYEHIFETFPLGEKILVTFNEIYFEIQG